ncbi:MAG: nucleotidyl transferase AbiEii/AbiGii toxin family protein [Patescibacteria group bacterium]
MLNKEKHQLIMGRILQDIYSDTAIASLIGLKGGTCAYFFYGLPRFSVDLDFDLFSINEETQKIVFEKVKSILIKYGEIKNSRIKHFTIFSLLSYGDADHNIKVEINIRILMPNLKENYELKEYLGISMLAAKKDYLFASKLIALTLRSETAMRDIYDIWFFAKNNWDININVVKARTGKSIREYLADCITVVERVKDNEILRGLGEIISEKEKVWAKTNLRKETVLLLKNYQSVLK